MMVEEARKYSQICPMFRTDDERVQGQAVHAIPMMRLTLYHLFPYFALISSALASQLQYQRQIVPE